ncbi:MAG: bifunctional enoyl-CoA hydratase/phosphate acetyltransferase [Pirellulaceae bacterium]
MTRLENWTNRTFDEIHVGDTATLTHKLTQDVIEVFALISGDVDPFVLEREPESGTRTAANTAQAAAAGAVIAAVLGTKLPGPGMEIVEQALRFSGAVAVGDHITATVTAKDKQSEGHVVTFACQCANQDGDELVSGTVRVAAPTQRITYKDVAPPRLALRRGDAFMRLYESVKDLPPVPCAIVHPCDRAALLGPIEAARRGIIDPVLVGPTEKIQAAADAAEIDLRLYRVEPAPHSHASATRAVELARSGEVEALMKGSLHTDELMRAVLPSAAGLRTARRVSHVFVMDVPTYPRLLLITDAAINIAPDLAQKVDIVQNAIDLAHVVGIACPKVAVLSAVETVNPKIPSTLEAAALCKMMDRGQITGGLLDGPLAFDNAISVMAAQTKGIQSEVAGRADILVVPDLEAGNMLAKQLSFLAGAESAGIVVGARVPIVLTSRADSVRSRLASTAVMSLVAHDRHRGKPGIT